MKAGIVTRLRVNPKDCQSVLDTLDAAGVPRDNISFSQAASLALATLLETARHSGLIPEPDPFQYLSRLTPYLSEARVPKARRASARLTRSSGGLHQMTAPAREWAGEETNSAEGLPGEVLLLANPRERRGGEGAEARSAQGTEPAEGPELEAAKLRLTKLLELQDHLSPEEWQPLEKEYQEVLKIVYPFG